MKDILYTILQLATMIIAAVIARYVIPWLKEKIGEQRLDEIAAWAVWAVDWAEQIIVTPGSGAQRKTMVMDFLMDIIEKKGVPLTEDQLEVLIESAVRQMHVNEPVEIPEQQGETI